MYADDTTLLSSLAYFGNDIETKEYLINAELSNVIEWLNINKLSLNKSKSKYMIFHVPNKDIQYLTLKIDNVIIEKVDEFNFLGLTMDTNLNWKKHSEKISNKCTKMIGIFRIRIRIRIRIIYLVIFQTQETSAKTISGRCRRGHLEKHKVYSIHVYKNNSN